MRTHVLPRWGPVPLARIDHISLQAWVTELGQRRSRATVVEALRLTSAVLRSAVRNRLIPFNPAEDVRAPRTRTQGHRRTDHQPRRPARPAPAGGARPLPPPWSPPPPAPDCGGVRSPDSGRCARPGCRAVVGDPDCRGGQRTHHLQALPEVPCRPPHGSPTRLVGLPDPRTPRELAGPTMPGRCSLTRSAPAAAHAVPLPHLASVAGAAGMLGRGRPARKRL
jgi:hypothetical protein